MIQRVENELDLLERHLTVLRLVFEQEPIGIVALSNETGEPHHKVRYSLRVLEEEGLVEPTNQGAVTTEKALEFTDTSPDRINEIAARLEDMKVESSPIEQ